jgi:transposase
MGMLTDDQWTRIEAGIRAVGIRGGKPRADDRQTIEGILWRFANGAKWRSVPAEFGPWHRVAQRFRRWAVAGVWEKLFEILKAAGESQLGMVFLDGTVIRAHQKAAGARRPQEALETAPELKTRPALEALGRSKGGFGTKAVGLCDGACWLSNCCRAKPMNSRPPCSTRCLACRSGPLGTKDMTRPGSETRSARWAPSRPCRPARTPRSRRTARRGSTTIETGLSVAGRGSRNGVRSPRAMRKPRFRFALGSSSPPLLIGSSP